MSTNTWRTKNETAQFFLDRRLTSAIKYFMPTSVKELITRGAIIDPIMAICYFMDGLREIKPDITASRQDVILKRDVIETFYMLVENLDFSTARGISKNDLIFIHSTILDANLTKMLINVLIGNKYKCYFIDIIEADHAALLIELEQNGTQMGTWDENDSEYDSEYDFCALVGENFTGHTTIDKRLCGILLENHLSNLQEIVYFTESVGMTFLIDFAVEFF